MHANGRLPKLATGAVILSFDPGLSTGVGLARVGEGTDFDVLQLAILRWENRFAVRDYLEHMPDRILLESFRLYRHKAQHMVNDTFPSCEVIGIIEAYAYQLGILDRVIRQPASVRQNVLVLDKHRDIVAAAGPEDHPRDAYKHIRYHIVVNRERVTTVSTASEGSSAHT